MTGAAAPAPERSDAERIFSEHRRDVFRRTDRLFAGLMIFQWVAVIAGGLWLTPLTWEGRASAVHPHLCAAVVLGTLVSVVPVWLALTRPGETMTRHVVAVGQMLMSALLIDVTGGRIETHFHVFGSLAFLAFYRDWRVLVSASAVVAADHFLRGLWFPLSVYGIENASPWRWLEHAAWVVFEDVFLVAACHRSVQEMRDIAERTADLRRERDRFEAAVDARTLDLAESVERFRSLSASSPVGIFETDADGRCVYVNQRWSEISGRSAEASLGTGWTEAVHAADREAVLRRWSEVSSQGRDWSVEYRLQLPSGEVRWVHSIGRCRRDEDGRLRGYVGTVEDVTARHAADAARTSLEEQLRQSQKMEAVGRLAGGIAHDFNNLLTVILGFGHMIRQNLGPSHPETAQIDHMLRAGERAADLTHQLLAFSRRQVLQVTELDLREVVAETAPMLRRVIGEDVDLRTVDGADLGFVRADRGQLAQVLMNLAVNARDAMPAGGKLTIATQNVELDAAFAETHPEIRPGRYVLLTVSDSGVGMDAATRARLFEPFFTTKGLGRGTGLGLATVYGIVRQSDGHIAAYSEPGMGTTMKVYLPRVDETAPAAAAPAPRDEPLPRGHETILLVEDEQGVRDLAERVLRGLGYHVISSASAASALAEARTRELRIDLVLTDVVMPGMGGRELVERLSCDHPGVPALYMSGYTDDAIVRHGILRQEARFLQKPFTPAVLAQRVRQALDGAPGAGSPASEAAPVAVSR